MAVQMATPSQLTSSGSATGALALSAPTPPAVPASRGAAKAGVLSRSRTISSSQGEDFDDFESPRDDDGNVIGEESKTTQ